MVQSIERQVRICGQIALLCEVVNLAFPAISCAAYRFPFEKACLIAINEINRFLSKNEEIEKVYLVCFEPKIFNQYLSILGTFG